MTDVTKKSSMVLSLAEHVPTRKGKDYSTAKVYLSNKTGQKDEILAQFAAPAPDKARVSKSLLNLWFSSSWSGTATITLRKITTSWDKSSVTWNSRPSTSPSGSITFSLSGSYAANAKISIDVTDHVQSWTSGEANWGWHITSNITGDAKFHGPTGKNPPSLTTTYSMGTTVPTGMYPGSAADDQSVYISTDKPALQVDYNAVTVSEQVDALQVRTSSSNAVGANNEFTSFTWDSGTVANPGSAIAYMSQLAGAPSLANNGSYWWNMRLRGTDGLWTPWSPPVRVFRRDLNVLTIATPSGSPGIIESALPQFSWTFTGSNTQRAFRMIIRKGTEQAIHHDSGLIPSTATTYSPPSGVINEEGASYNVELSVYDNYNRQSVATGTGTTARDVSIATKTVSYQPAPITSVTNLRVLDGAPYPRIALKWDRATDPDYFEIWRDGTLLEADITPSELMKSGITYTYIDVLPAAMTEHVYEVRAVEARRASKDNPKAKGTNRTTLAWLIDTERDIFIPISGEAPVTAKLYEEGAVLNPINSKSPVRITSNLGGFTGSVQGGLCGDCLKDGTDSRQLRDLLLSLREDVGRQFLLNIADHSCKVVIYNINTFTRYGPQFGKVYDVSFDWHEVP